MRTQSPDTHPDAERVQIELLRKAGEARRLGLVRSMSRTVIQWSRQTIRQANPDASEEELALLFVALHYNQALADGLRADLARRRQKC
jgi:hypothetical protein